MAGEAARTTEGPESSVEEFVASMPDSYRLGFLNDPKEHAAIAARRGDRSAHLELWRTSNDGTNVVCVVADDRPACFPRFAGCSWRTISTS
jgi:hypothetical protein